MSDQIPDYVSNDNIGNDINSSIPDYVGNNEQVDGKIEKSESLLSRVLGGPSAAVREGMRSVATGSPKNVFESAVRGLNHPSQSETFQHEAVRNVFSGGKGGVGSVGDYMAMGAAPALAGFGADIVTDPLTYVAKPVIGGVLKGAGWAGSAIGKTPFGKGVSKVVESTGNIGKGFGNVFTKSSRLNYMDKIENAVYEARKSASPQFGKAIDTITKNNPEKSVDLSEIGESLINSEDSLVQRALLKSPELQNLATHPTGQVSLQEGYNALNALKTQIPKNVLAGPGKRSMHLGIMDLVDDMSMSISKDFPEIQGARNAYGQVVNDFRTIRPKVRGDSAERNLFGSQGILDFKGRPFMGGERSEESFKNLVGPKTFKEAIGTNRASKIAGLGKKALIYGPAEEFIRRKL